MRGVRGATVIPPGREESENAVAELLAEMVAANGIDPDDLAAAWFSLPAELNELRAAAVARRMGWSRVPLLEVCQPERAEDVRRCLRVMLLWNTDREANDVRHIYLGEAARLRPDLAAQ